MNTIPPFTNETALELKAILDARARPALHYSESCGFLFVVACSPQMINPNQWLPMLLNEPGTEPDNSDADTNTVGLMVSHFNEINRQVQSKDLAQLPGCEFREDPMSNLAEDAVVQAWSRGFIIGHDWQKRAMFRHTPKELKTQLNAQMMVLTFFASHKTAELMHAETKKDDVTLESMAADMQNMFPDAVADFAHLARSIQQVVQQKGKTQQPQQSSKIARNDPCPCGSEKKYKKCCGSVT